MAPPISYILPIRSQSTVSDELLSYLRFLTSLDTPAQIVVVDGSGPAVFADFDVRCPHGVQHVRVDADLTSLANGKVAGVLTGLRRAEHPVLVIADEDVRYDEASLSELVQVLDSADIVRPQNFFAPMPWHARLDTARTLINRVTGGDWPGTFGVRRSVLEWTGGYDGNVLFENLELVRTVKAAGGRECCRLDLFVRRLPPSSRHFWSQRVRQAYDEFARPTRLAASLALAPALVLTVVQFRWLGLGVAIAAPLVVAEIGRRIGRGWRVFPASATLAAPLWVLERSVSAWLAVVMRFLHGGVPYSGRILTRAATPYRVLVQRHGARHTEGPTGLKH